VVRVFDPRRAVLCAARLYRGVGKGPRPWLGSLPEHSGGINALPKPRRHRRLRLRIHIPSHIGNCIGLSVA